MILFEKENLGLTAGDVRLLYSLVDRTHLAYTEFEDAVDIFRVASSGTPGIIPRDNFEAALRELIPAASVRKAAAPALTRLFQLTDRLGSQGCDFGELVAAFSLFCAGSKSDKLSLAFKLLDTNGDGRLTRRQLWRFLRSFLTALFSLSSAVAGDEVEALYTVVDDATVSIAKTVFAQLGEGADGDGDTNAPTGGGRKSLTFDEFGDWYNRGGFRLIPWLELLDLVKWPFSEAQMEAGADADADADADDVAMATATGRGAGGDGGEEEEEEEGEGDDDGDEEGSASDDKPMLQFPLSPEEGLYLVLAPSDVSAYNDLLTNTQLYLVEPYTVVNEFLRVEEDGTLSRANFRRVTAALCPVTPLSRPVQEALGSIYDAFEINSTGSVDMSSFLAGFLMLAAGNKSEKLLLAFKLFDSDCDGCGVGVLCPCRWWWWCGFVVRFRGAVSWCWCLCLACG